MPEFSAGVFLIDKPVGPSSFAMVRQVRRLLAVKKVGHAGTLDPFASGLLVICAGRAATKMISRFMEGEKEYLATIHLGVETSTLDPEGEITAKRDVGVLSTSQIAECLAHFRGDSLQKPPHFSALKHKGKPLYYYARQGIEVEKPPRPVHISLLEQLEEEKGVDGHTPLLHIRVKCSKGTYIRTLAADIGERLGCGAYLQELRRQASGIFSVDQAVEGRLLATENGKKLLLENMLSLEDVSKLLQ